MIDGLTVESNKTHELRNYFTKIDYRWSNITEGVPLLYVKSLPADMNRAVSTKVKKETFFMSLLPMVLQANNEIQHERQLAVQLLGKLDTDNLSSVESTQLAKLVRRYRLKGINYYSKSFAMELLSRIDEIPPALVLAQAANESAWGTSRFAREANNLFGQWTFTKGAGIVPKGRPAGATYEVQKFSSIYESIRSYMRNLNTHRAYSGLRTLRSSARHAGRTLNGLELANGLHKYSERGSAYVREIQSIIRYNSLSKTSHTFLRVEAGELLAVVTDSLH